MHKRSLKSTMMMVSALLFWPILAWVSGVELVERSPAVAAAVALSVLSGITAYLWGKL